MKIVQPAKGYRVAVDSPLLAAAVRAKAGDRVLDLGIGTGAVTLCLAARIKDLQLYGLEKNAEYLELLRQSAVLNGFSIDAREGDVLAPPPDFQNGDFDVVVANPPYFEDKSYYASPNQGKSEAHAAYGSRLNDWVMAAAKALKVCGAFYVIFPADGQKLLCDALTKSFSSIVVSTLLAKEDGPPKRVIVKAGFGKGEVRQGRSHPIRCKDNDYPPHIRAVLWDGVGLEACE